MPVSQTIEFEASTATAKFLLFALGDDTVVASANTTPAVNAIGTHTGTVEDVAAGLYKFRALTADDKPTWGGWVRLRLESDTYIVTDSPDPATVQDVEAVGAALLTPSDVQSSAAAAIAAANLPNVTQLNARTKLAAEYFDPNTHFVMIGANGISELSLSSAAIAKIEAAFLNDADGVAFKDALMQVIEDELDASDVSVLAIADTVVNRLFAALVADHSSEAGSWGQRLSRLPNAAAGSAGGLPTVDASNRIAGIQGTLHTLDDLDTAQDAQHTATQVAIAALEDLSQSDVQFVLTSLGYSAGLASNLGTTNTRIDVALSSRAAPGAAMALTSAERTSVAQSVWNYAVGSIATAGSIGKLIVDRVATLLRLDGLLEDSEGDRLTAHALSAVSLTIDGGDASEAKQDEIISLLNAMSSDGGSGGGTGDPVEVGETDAETVANIRAAAWQKLALAMANPKPNYSIDGQSVSWADYRKGLQDTIAWCDQMAGQLQPFEEVSRGIV